MTKRLLTLQIISLLTVLPLAGTKLSGSIEGTIGPGELLVSGMVEIDQNKTLTIKPGTKLLFENFSGLVVYGTLRSHGTAESPVIFTSANDDSSAPVRPEPFDWNGIKVTPNARAVHLAHARIYYSTFGLSVESERTGVLLEKVDFRHNGYTSFARAGKIVPTWDGTPNDFQWGVVERSGQKERGASRTKEPGKHKPWMMPTIIGSSLLTVAGAGCIIGGHIQAENNHQKYMAVRPDDFNAAQLLADYKQKRDSAVTLRDIGTVLTVLGAAGLVVTFVF